MTVGELLNRMTAKELGEWMSYYKLNPFGERRADVRQAITSCVIANANRGKNQAPFTVEQFMPKFGPPEPMSSDEIKNVLKGLCHG
jgi:hypothetical protein